MSIIMSIGIKYFKRLLNKKGQGIVEFALLCSFCAAIALFARDAGFSEAFNESLDKSFTLVQKVFCEENSDKE